MFPILEAGSPDTETTSLPAFLVARDGLYLRKRSLLGLSQTRVEHVAHLPVVREFVDYALPKVPADLMARVVGFFRAVYREHKTEALVLLLWRDEAFDLAVPAQSVTGVSVSFDHAESDIPAGSRVVGTIHSHAGFAAFASGVDEDDEADLDGLHIVIGNVDRPKLSYAAAIVVDGVRFESRAGSLLERPRRMVEPSSEWMAKVTVAKPMAAKGKTSASSLKLLPALTTAKSGTREELDELLDRADSLANALGLRLSIDISEMTKGARHG
jgi:proteasome lid subunit RPN8/RPN11